MTDSRLPDEWLGHPKFDRLSDPAWRVFTCALMYCNRYGTDGRVNRMHFKYLHPDENVQPRLDELKEQGLGEFESGDFVFCGWQELGQSPAELVRRQKERNRLKQKNYRQRISNAGDGDALPVT